MGAATFWISIGSLSLITASPALAAEAAKAADKPSAPAAAMKSPPNLDAMFALFDKLFPPQPDPDPARLALARTSVQSMWPDGTYGELMTGFMGPIMERGMQLKTSDFTAMAGMKAKGGSTDKDLSLHDTLAGKDPYFDQRVAAIRAVVTEEIGKVSLIIDPHIRDGLGRAMARRFDAQQLAEINRFFATATGQKFAGQALQLWVDPDAIRSMFGSMPEMMKLMPEMIEKLKAANDKFPKPPESKAEPKKATGAKTTKH